MNRRPAQGPGLAKCGVDRPFARRVLTLVRCSDALWQRWFEKVDVVSEGMVGPEDGGLVYRGSTSLIVLSDRHGGLLPHDALAGAVHVAMCDPHFWLRAARAARLEAASRCSGELYTIHVDLKVSDDPKGIRADIDVDGRVAGAAHAVKRKR
jgi:hypothetical protein